VLNLAEEQKQRMVNQLTDTEREIYAEAQQMYEADTDYKLFHNHFFSQNSPLLKDKTREERRDFINSNFYKLLDDLECRLGLEQGYLFDDEVETSGEAGYNGRFVLRLPRTLHRALSIKARRENISLNQLCLTKLAIPLRGMVKDYI